MIEARPETVEAVKAGSAFAILISWFAHLTPPDWAGIAAFIYSLMLIAEKLYRWMQARKAGKRRNRRWSDPNES